MLESGPDSGYDRRTCTNDDSIKGIWCVLFKSYRKLILDEVKICKIKNLQPRISEFTGTMTQFTHLYDLDQRFWLSVREREIQILYISLPNIKGYIPGSVLRHLPSHNNLEDIKKRLKMQTIGHDKVNQLRYFKKIHGMVEHVKSTQTHSDLSLRFVLG